jgi:O-antigen/teichoic acid export membrane protein
MKQFVSLFSASSGFIKDSGILFGINIINAILNYGVTIFVANKLGQDSYSLWTALIGIIAILSTVSSGIMTEFTKQSSRIAKKSKEEAVHYYRYFQKRMLVLSGVGLIVSPLFGYILSTVFNKGSVLLFGFVIVLVVFQLTQSINSQFFLAILDLKKFIVLSVFSTVFKAVFVITIILAGFGVYALPISLIMVQILGFIIGTFFIKSLNITPPEIKKDYHIFQHVKGVAFITVILFCLALFLNSGPIVAEKIFNTQEKDILAILFNFGQIIHFGATATLGGLITYASRDNSKKIVATAYLMVGSISVGVGIVFTLFGSFIMKLFGRPQYVDQLPLILYYSLFIALYNLIFVSVQYLIARNEYKPLYAFIIGTGVLLVSQFTLTKSLPYFNPTYSFVTISSVISLVTLLYLVVRIFKMVKTT